MEETVFPNAGTEEAHRSILKPPPKTMTATVLALASLAAAVPSPDALTPAADTVVIEQWTVPWPESRPRDPYVAPDGRVWFVGQRSDYVAVFDPASESFEKIDLPEGAGPHNLIVDDQGVIWYAGNRNATIGRLDPESGEITELSMPLEGARDPHTLVFGAGQDIWFTLQGSNMVGHLDTASRQIHLLPVPTEGSRPYGIAVGTDGRVWFNQVGVNQLGVIDPEKMEVREIVLPREEARDRRIGITSDGAVWYVDWGAGHLGRVDPETEEVREWPVPGGKDARPYGMAVDDRDRIWFVETGSDPNRLLGFDPTTGEFFSQTEIDSGAVRHMFFHQVSRTIWFGTDSNTLARFRVP